jgi:predicted ATP-dependent serine protease
MTISLPPSCPHCEAALSASSVVTPTPGAAVRVAIKEWRIWAVVFGEIGLSGDVRSVGRAEARLREAQKLGFDHLLCPPLPQSAGKTNGVKVTSATRLTDVVERISQNRY